MLTGRYQARAVCVGAGTVTLTVELGSDEAAATRTPISRTQLQCSSVAPAATSMAFTVPNKTQTRGMYLTLSPDWQARGQAAAGVTILRP